MIYSVMFPKYFECDSSNYLLSLEFAFTGKCYIWISIFFECTPFSIGKIILKCIFYGDSVTVLRHIGIFYACTRFNNILYKICFATVYKGNIIKNLIMDCQSYTKYRPNETTGGIFVSWRRKEELPTGLD